MHTKYKFCNEYFICIKFSYWILQLFFCYFTTVVYLLKRAIVFYFLDLITVLNRKSHSNENLFYFQITKLFNYFLIYSKSCSNRLLSVVNLLKTVWNLLAFALLLVWISALEIRFLWFVVGKHELFIRWKYFVRFWLKIV